MTRDLDCRQIINHRNYPIDEPGHPARARVIEQVRASLAGDGCAVIRNFFSDEGLEALLAEAEARKNGAYFSPRKLCNVYLNDGDPDYPADHPLNVFIPRSNGFITADCFGGETAARRLYHWEPLKHFLAECLGKDQLFIYEDPVSNMIVNLGKTGQEFNWHFDTNEFTITMLLQAAAAGGVFEYVPGLRSPDDESYPAVRQVLNGDRSRVRRLQLNAGDLQFFLGRFSLHRVTENTGAIDRLLLIMSFSEKPGMVGNRARVRNLYGKLTDAHTDERVRADGLVD
ncbi:MAG TPA: hypothetical protein VKB27_17720 [Gammaproteobacteria bacterium]|nr:hypothetical protein [Gammaproteobacteria bacterium]